MKASAHVLRAKRTNRGKYPKLKELASIFADMDLDGDDHVSYEEICDYIDERVDGKRRRKDDGSDEDRSLQRQNTDHGAALKARSILTTSIRAVMGICRRRR